MDWNSRRITAILENALNEDRATSDATSYACIDPTSALRRRSLQRRVHPGGLDACADFDV